MRQLLTSFGPFVAACVAMYLAYPISYFLGMALGLPAGTLLVRFASWAHPRRLAASLQHRFDTARCARRANWNPLDASMEGTSWFRLPRSLQWLTGNIGFHHVHHLNPRVPSYRLSAAHEAVQALWPVAPLGLRGGLARPVSPFPLFLAAMIVAYALLRSPE